jgi:hypothetical protein
VHRVRTPDQWDALVLAILHQYNNTKAARSAYRALCATHGDNLSTTVGPVDLVPTPETVLTLADRDFARVGIPAKRYVGCAGVSPAQRGLGKLERGPRDLLPPTQPTTTASIRSPTRPSAGGERPSPTNSDFSPNSPRSTRCGERRQESNCPR